MTSHAEKVLSRFRALDKALQKKGFPATSPWWHETIRKFYESDKRQLVIRAGRRAGKSSTLSRLGVCEALFGEHKIPPGDTGVVAIVSTRREEAAERITTVKAILDALGQKYFAWGEYGVRLVDRPIGFRVYTASVAGVSGFTGIFVFCDELSKWKDNDTGQNPATMVLASVRPTMLTQRNARIILSSSPVGQYDAHYDAFEMGDTPLQMVAHAPTWVANPSVTEQQTRDDEHDPATWEREYAAIPQAEVAESLLTEEEVNAATSHKELPPTPRHSYYAATDPAFSGNAWTLLVGTQLANGKKAVAVSREWIGTSKAPLQPRQVLAEIAALLKSYNVDILYSDQASGAALRDLAALEGITLVPHPWTAGNKMEAYRNLQTLIRTQQVALNDDPQVKKDLLGIRRKTTRSGTGIELLKTPDGRHCDYAPAMAKLLSLHMDTPTEALHLPGSEEERRAKRREKFLKDREEAAKPGRPWRRHQSYR